MEMEYVNVAKEILTYLHYLMISETKKKFPQSRILQFTNDDKEFAMQPFRIIIGALDYQ